MSVTNSLANALTGLSAAARRAEVVSSNISNALTDGYGRREINLSSQSLAGNGAGVRVEGVTRIVDMGVVQDRRLADASLGDANTRAGFYNRLEALTGSPDAPGSLSDRIARFESSLLEAASRPDADVRLQNVVSAAKGLVSQVNAISAEVQSARMDADRAIGLQVDELNNALQQVRDLNVDIARQKASGYDANALMDQRQQTVDRIASLVPIRQVPRENDQIALFSPGGAILLDGNPALIGFAPAGVITPDMTQASGALSGLTLNGIAYDTSAAGSRLAGGSLIGQFAVRDELAVAAQTQIDAVARDLVSRFQGPAVDPTLGPASAGLFTDSGAFFDAANEEGLAGRLSLNATVDPALGGDLWKLRDGVNAIAPGEVGNAAQLQRLSGALTGLNVPASGGLTTAARTLSGLASDFLSAIGGARQAAEADGTYARLQSDTFRATELQNGVDTDYEMQQLLLVEAAFAANAKVLQAADDMIQTLLGL